MYKKALSTLFISVTVMATACEKQAEITPATDESSFADERPTEESDEEADAQEDAPAATDDGDNASGSNAPPTGDGDMPGNGGMDEEIEEEIVEPPASGAFAGDMTVTINTTFGPDTCSGTAAINLADDGYLNGTGSCSFGILGAQSPGLAGFVAEDGAVTGTVDMSAFGAAFTLDWTGFKDENTLVSSYNGTTSLVGVGEVTYEVILNLEVDASGGAAGAADALAEFVDFGNRGDATTFVESGNFTSRDGCNLDYDLYTPDEAITDTLTVIMHGFSRSKAEFAGMAGHLASWGLPAVTMDLCHAWALDVDLNQNGADVVDLVEALWAGPVIYMGHSNGAISSLVAASMDDQAVAVLGLDPVERVGGDHTGVAASLSIPVAGIFGEAGACNAWNSGMDAYMAAPENDLFRTTEADHCDFEAPTGTVCTLACSGSNDYFSDDEIRSNIMSLGTAFISWHAIGDEDAMEWADPTGGARAALVAMGAISGL